MEATAIAHANVALVKYWGKHDPILNTPAVGSISLTLSELWTRTTVSFRRQPGENRLYVNDRRMPPSDLDRVGPIMNQLRRLTAIDSPFEIRSFNNFPTAAGLASSASSQAALALAASHAVGHPLSPAQTSALARLGSASAARSVFGGFVELPAGGDQRDAPAAAQIADEHAWPLSVLVAVTDENPKAIGSRAAMLQTQHQSPFYQAWVDAAAPDLESMRAAIRRRDFEAMGALAENSALKLHGLIMSARPGLIYWTPGTIAVIREIQQLRREGLAVYFTIDAGPQVKAICRESDQAAVADRLRALPDVRRLIVNGPGPAARIVETT